MIYPVVDHYRDVFIDALADLPEQPDTQIDISVQVRPTAAGPQFVLSIWMRVFDLLGTSLSSAIFAPLDACDDAFIRDVAKKLYERLKSNEMLHSAEISSLYTDFIDLTS